MIDVKEVEKQARAELNKEAFRRAVEARKEELRKVRPWLHRIFPWRLVIVRR